MPKDKAIRPSNASDIKYITRDKIGKIKAVWGFTMLFNINNITPSRIPKPPGEIIAK